MAIILHDLGLYRGSCIGKFQISSRSQLILRRMARDTVAAAKAGTLGEPFRIPSLSALHHAIGNSFSQIAVIAEARHLPQEITPPDEDFLSFCSHVIFPPRIESPPYNRPVLKIGFILRKAEASAWAIEELCRAGMITKEHLEKTMFINPYRTRSYDPATKEAIRQTMVAMLRLLKSAQAAVNPS